MEVFLIRHTTPEVSPGLIYGHTDVALAGSFGMEKQMVKDQLPEGIEYVVSSPSSRCTLLAREINKTFTTDDRLRELNFGRWEGMTWDTIDRAESERWMENFVENCPPGGETLEEMNYRVLNFWKGLHKLPYQRIAIVTHAGVIRLILSAVKSKPIESLFDVKVNYGDVIFVDTNPSALS